MGRTALVALVALVMLTVVLVVMAVLVLVLVLVGAGAGARGVEGGGEEVGIVVGESWCVVRPIWKVRTRD